MSVDSTQSTTLAGGVDVEVTGYLVARAGTHGSHVPIARNATVADVVEELADSYGEQVRPALMAGDRLRSDTVAVRSDMGREERLFAGSEVHTGDSLRFETLD